MLAPQVPYLMELDGLVHLLVVWKKIALQDARWPSSANCSSFKFSSIGEMGFLLCLSLFLQKLYMKVTIIRLP